MFGRHPALALRAAPLYGVASLRASIRRIWGRIRSWLRPVVHAHEWHDWYVFDSSATTTCGPRPRFRVVSQQIMMLCACGETERKPLQTWAEARMARKRLPYKRWGVWSFSLPVPLAIAIEARQRQDAKRPDPKGESAGL
jgi:hypothetical protein